jgi:hypothetical protein
MALPVQAAPIHTLKVPSTNKDYKFRPFLVKEEKALLLAQQSEDAQVMVDTLKAVIKSCAKSEIDTDNLATFDIEYIFSQIRAKSVGETVELYFFCDDCEDREKARAKVSIDLTKLKVAVTEGHNKKVDLFADVGVVMKYPPIDILKKIESMSNEEVDLVFDIVIECIDYIYQGEEVYHAKEQSKKELEEFINNLTQEQFGKIQKFFETMPKLTQQVKYSCPVCNKAHDKTLEGLGNFF